MLRHLDSNALVCDCDLRSLGEFMQDYAQNGQTQATATYEYLRGCKDTVTSVTEEEFSCGMYVLCAHKKEFFISSSFCTDLLYDIVFGRTYWKTFLRNVVKSIVNFLLIISIII